MSSSDTFTLCPYCQKRVEPGDPGVVYAVEIKDVPGFGEVHHYVDGLGGFFHPGHPPEAIGWQRRELPSRAA